MIFIKTRVQEPVFEDGRKRERDCSGLREQLSDPNPVARRWAARELINCPAAAVALVERLKIEPEFSVQEVILTTLIRLGDPASVSGLIDCLRSEDTALRNEAIEALKNFPEGIGPTVMRGLLADPDPDVRIFAVNILESLRRPEVESWLIEVIEKDPHVNVCATALDLLSEVGTEAALEPVARLKARFADEPYIQFATDVAFKRICGS